MRRVTRVREGSKGEQGEEGEKVNGVAAVTRATVEKGDGHGQSDKSRTCEPMAEVRRATIVKLKAMRNGREA